jgi:cholesterol transport system auxiliary component
MICSANRLSGVTRHLAAWCTVGAALLGGCASVDMESSSTTQMFDLSVQQSMAAPPRKTPRNVQLVVYEPITIRTLDGDRVVVRLPNSQVNYLDGARWSDRLPALLHESLIDVLTKSRQFRVVSNGRDKVDADVSLSSTIQTFEVDLGQGGRAARVSLAAKMVDERTGSVLDTRLLTASTPLKANAPSDHVAAIKAAFATVSAELVAWVNEIAIKPRKDKLPAAIARGAIQPTPGSSGNRITRSRHSKDTRL